LLLYKLQLFILTIFKLKNTILLSLNFPYIFMPTKESKSLQIGAKTPDFTAEVQNSDGSVSTITLSNLLESGKVLLIFYPGDDTPGCTAQLCGVRDVYSTFTKLGVTVLGVNPANAESHLKFIKKFDYPFGIIIDEDKTIREKFGAIGSFFGKPTTRRSVFLLDNDGTCLYRFFGQQDNNKIFEILEGGK
jgi:thioredoxin-dependent peroxiredoxin